MNVTAGSLTLEEFIAPVGSNASCGWVAHEGELGILCEVSSGPNHEGDTGLAGFPGRPVTKGTQDLLAR